ncbi:hypothetical protein C0991_004156, partial [Blastosporella zonata]
QASGAWERLNGPTPALVGETRERARQELLGHTGDTDSELDELDDDDDEAASKGKVGEGA